MTVGDLGERHSDAAVTVPFPLSEGCATGEALTGVREVATASGIGA